MDQALDIEELDYDSLPDHTRQKRLAVVAMLAVAMLSPLLSIAISDRGADIITSICLNILGMTWVYFDSLELGEPIDAGTRAGVVLLGFIMIPIYLYRSRGFKYGSIALARMIGLAIILLFLQVGMTLLLYYFGLIKA